MNLTQQIKEYALKIGFDACGISKAESIEKESENVKSWIEKGYYADMDYMARNFDKRCDPTLLVDSAKSIISIALNYYPHQIQDTQNPQIAYYAYGKDYHDVMKEKGKQLLDFIQTLDPNINGRVFCDTAPVLEKYWAAKSGIGYIGKNSLLIIPYKGSFFFIGELIINKELEYDKPIKTTCGKCSRCLDACPTQALTKAYILDSNKCISYQTIENKNAINDNLIPHLKNRFYGCDICQLVCPWNRYAKPHTTTEFKPSEELLALTYEQIDNMTELDYQRIFKGSAMKRAKYNGLKRNIEALKENIK